MEYIDDPDEIEVNLAALEKIKQWADEQRMKLRKPMRPGEEQPASAEEPAPEGEALPDLDMPAEEPPADEDEEMTVLSLSRPGDRAPKMSPNDEIKKFAEGMNKGKQPVPKRK